MLIHALRVGEKIRIGEATLIVVDIDYAHGQPVRVRLGFSAPRSIIIDRKEVHDLRQQQEESS